jgi:hypothetical protein
MSYLEDLPQVNGAVEVFSKSFSTWIPATITAVVDERDVVVQYSVAGARDGAAGMRTKRIDVFDGELIRSIMTGKAFGWRGGGLHGPGRAAEFTVDRGPYAIGAASKTAQEEPEPAVEVAAEAPRPSTWDAGGKRGSTQYPRERDTVEVYSKSLGTWIPATVTAVVDTRDVVVHYSVAGAREGATGFRQKKVDIFEGDLIRDITTGLHFEPPNVPAPEPAPAPDADVSSGFDDLAATATLDGFDQLAARKDFGAQSFTSGGFRRPVPGRQSQCRHEQKAQFSAWARCDDRTGGREQVISGWGCDCCDCCDESERGLCTLWGDNAAWAPTLAMPRDPVTRRHAAVATYGRPR